MQNRRLNVFLQQGPAGRVVKPIGVVPGGRRGAGRPGGTRPPRPAPERGPVRQVARGLNAGPAVACQQKQKQDDAPDHGDEILSLNRVMATPRIFAGPAAVAFSAQRLEPKAQSLSPTRL